MTNPDVSNVRNSNYIKIIDKENVAFNTLRGLQKSFIKENV